MRPGSILLLAVLVLMLLGAVAVAVYMLDAIGDADLGVHGWTAMALGGFFSIVVGVGLMGLVFYSNRRGYDDPPSFHKEP
jgi:hypothetical protein